MFDQSIAIALFGATTLIAPMALVAILGVSSLIGRALPEAWTSRLVQMISLVGLCAAIGMLVLMLATGERHVPVVIGRWVAIDDFTFSIKLVFDRLSVPIVVLTFALCGVIGAFGSRYLHREPGFNRFFTLFAVFLLGMVLASLAGSIETLFAGWELVGVSSALLVAFFHERAAPVRNGLRVWSIYRVSDAALLIASVVLHHLRSHGDFDHLLGNVAWPDQHQHGDLTYPMVLLVGSLLLVAAAGKSALVPFSGWLPRAMEGPTPSSAIFYGALSVHLGAFLLLRMGPLFEMSLALCVATTLLGLTTSLLAVSAARVQSDIKSALAFASLTQVGLIVAEIGCAGIAAYLGDHTQGAAAAWCLTAAEGLRYFALVHILGHACLRTLQFLRASSVLQDYRMLENAIGERVSALRSASESDRTYWSWWYRLALERGYLDALLTDYIGRPILRLFHWFDSLERSWTDFLSGGRSRESDVLDPSAGSLQEEAP